MRKTKFILPFLIFSVSLGFQSHAQVTITENNFSRISGFVDSVDYTAQAGIVIPSEGANQVWDYSSLQSSNLYLNDFIDATTDTNYTNALNYINDDLEFQGFLIPSNLYEAIDSNGYYDQGRMNIDASYSITSISGGTNDSIRFVGGKKAFVGRIDKIKFPMTFDDEWTQSRDEINDFELNIAAYGLVNTPGTAKTTVTQTRKVVGYGKLIIPKADGTPSSPMDVLLIKRKETTIDSFFLGGAPAPAPLLSAFGLTQGSVDSSSYYVFYKPDFGNVVLNINLNNNNETTNAYFRTSAIVDTTTSIANVVLPEIKPFPNPVKAGQVFNFIMKSPVRSGSVSFFSLDGRLVFKSKLSEGSNQNLQVVIPKGMNQGLYMFHVTDELNQPILKGKLFVK